MSNTNQIIDTSFKGVERLLHQMARKGLNRLQAAGIMGADYDCVFGEMEVGYVKALNGFKPELGRKFTTFCVTVCWNEFNKYCERLEREHHAIGHVSLEEIGQSASGDGGFDPMELIADDVTESVEDAIERRQEAAITAKNLSRHAKFLLFHLAKPSKELNAAFEAHCENITQEREAGIHTHKTPEEMNIAFIGKHYNLTGKAIRDAKHELGRVYGIREWNRTRDTAI